MPHDILTMDTVLVLVLGLYGGIRAHVYSRYSEVVMIEACNPPRFSILVMGYEFPVMIARVTLNRADAVLTRKTENGIEVMIMPGREGVRPDPWVPPNDETWSEWTVRAVVHVRANSHGVWPTDIEHVS
jgi:hypothetical protein